MRQISCEEMVNLSDAYTGKQVEVSLFPIQSISTFRHFRLREEDNVFALYDIDSELPQELIIDKESIKEINFTEGNVFESVFSLVLNDGLGEVSFTVFEKPTICTKCRKIINTPYEPMWSMNEVGGYGSRWDMERLIVNFCDDCMGEILGDNENVVLN